MRRTAIAAIVGVAVSGCGTTHRGSLTVTSSATELGRPIVTAPFAVTTSPARSTPWRRPVAPRRLQAEHIHLPATSQTASAARAVRRIAGQFGRAYLSYQIGGDTPAVLAAIRATCTSQFARLLLAQPASVPPAERSSPAFARARLTAVRYTGQATFGASRSLQIAVATYQLTQAPTVRGSLIIEVERDGRRWRVSGVRPQ